MEYCVTSSMEYHGIPQSTMEYGRKSRRGAPWNIMEKFNDHRTVSISMDTQGIGMALGHVRYNREAVWYDGSMTAAVTEGPLELLGKKSQPGPVVWAPMRLRVPWPPRDIE